MAFKFRYDITISALNQVITLPVGLKKAKFFMPEGTITLAEIGTIGPGLPQDVHSIEFPIIDGKSPNTFTVSYISDGDNIALTILVEELGATPDPNYFEKEE